eukprot:gene21957-29007_t
MRSVGGGYDNESIAVTAMSLTADLYELAAPGDLYTLAAPGGGWGVAAGLAYFYMVAAWDGYVFVLNMVAAHAGLLVLMGRFSTKLYRAYTLFYLVGTLLAVNIPVVGWTPLKSMEQLLQYGEGVIARKQLDRVEANAYRIRLVLLSALGLAAVTTLMGSMGMLGPVSMRSFHQHTRPVKPLGKTACRAQATSPDAYWHYLHYCCFMAPVGFVICLLAGRKGDAKYFTLLYALTAYYFANKMNRFILLAWPVASSLSRQWPFVMALI